MKDSTFATRIAHRVSPLPRAGEPSEGCPTGPSLLTLEVHGGGAPFAEPPLAEPVLSLAGHHPATLAAILMPDHLRWLIRDGWEVEETVGRFKAYSGRLAREAGHRGPVWGRGYRQLPVPSTAPLGELVREMLRTPVRAALVPRPEDYPWQVVRLDRGWGRW